jgi:hypothetical protein
MVYPPLLNGQSFNLITVNVLFEWSSQFGSSTTAAKIRNGKANDTSPLNYTPSISREGGVPTGIVATDTGFRFTMTLPFFAVNVH